MAVTKRCRFEVLRRDGHACRYCGQCAPDVKLTVDHVVPKALGGKDEPSNLVAACVDCNAGKSSSSPDAAMVDEVREDALKHAERVRQAYAVLVESLGGKDDYISDFLEAWPDKHATANWRGSIAEFWRMGVPIELVQDAIDIASSKPYVEPGAPRFKYMCGVLWNQIETVSHAVREREALEGSWLTSTDIDQLGMSNFEWGKALAMKYSRPARFYAAALSHVCDGLYPFMPKEHADSFKDGV